MPAVANSKTKKTKTPDEIGLNSFYRQYLEGPDQGRTLGNYRDPIYRQHGGMSEAELCFLDPQVSACFLIKAFAVLNKEIVFTPPKNIKKKRDQKKSQEAADFLNFTIKKIAGSDIQMRFDLMTSSFFGYAFEELVYDVLTVGKYAGYYYYSRVKSKRPGLWAFHFDSKGNIDGYQSLINKSFIAPKSQMMSMSWLPLWNNPHGTGDYLKVRKFEKAKREFIVFLLTLAALQSKGKQNIVQGPEDNTDGADSTHDDLLNKLNNYLSVFVPDTYTLKFEKFDTKILEDFLKVLRWLDIQIATAMLSNSMTTNQNEKSGSHAMASAQIETGTFTFTNYACRVMQEILDEEYAKNLLELNYSPEELPEELWPVCKLVDPESVNLEAQAKLDEILERIGILDLGTEADLADRRKLYNLPDNPELFSEDKDGPKTAEILKLVRQLEKQTGQGNQISTQLQKILSGQEPEPKEEEYFDPDNADDDDLAELEQDEQEEEG